MKKDSYTDEAICDMVLEYEVETINSSVQKLDKEKLDFYVTNGQGWKMEGCDDLVYSKVQAHKVIVKFLSKYTKKMKKNRRPLYDFEFGGPENSFAKENVEILKLAKHAIYPGRYNVYLGEDTTAFLFLEIDEKDEDIYHYHFYIMGENYKKFKKKIEKMIQYYTDIRKSQKSECLIYLDGKPMQPTVFKPFDKVVMKNKQKVLDRIDDWLASVPELSKEGIVPRLSFLLYGEPGTGKSTFCKALARYLDISAITVVQPDYFTEDTESQGRRRMNVPSILSIDDIDCICDSRDNAKDKENDRILARLLAFLDELPTTYIKAKDGMQYSVSIVVATTNYIERLDDALKRNGRFDDQIRMDIFDRDEAEEMCQIYKTTLDEIMPLYKSYEVERDEAGNIIKDEFKVSPVTLQAKCMEHLERSIRERMHKKEN